MNLRNQKNKKSQNMFWNVLASVNSVWILKTQISQIHDLSSPRKKVKAL